MQRGSVYDGSVCVSVSAWLCVYRLLHSITLQEHKHQAADSSCIYSSVYIHVAMFKFSLYSQILGFMSQKTLKTCVFVMYVDIRACVFILYSIHLNYVSTYLQDLALKKKEDVKIKKGKMKKKKKFHSALVLYDSNNGLDLCSLSPWKKFWFQHMDMNTKNQQRKSTLGTSSWNIPPEKNAGCQPVAIIVLNMISFPNPKLNSSSSRG